MTLRKLLNTRMDDIAGKIIRLEISSAPIMRIPSTIVTAVGFSNGRNIAITSGLEVGDVIVTEGANNVVEGQKVLF